MLLEGLGPRQLLHRGLAEHITPNVRVRACECVCVRARERDTTKCIKLHQDTHKFSSYANRVRDGRGGRGKGAREVETKEAGASRFCSSAAKNEANHFS